MKLRSKIGLGLLGFFGLLVTTLAITIGYTSACGPTSKMAVDGTTMKAITYDCYGGPEVLQYGEVEKPTPAADEVLVKVRAAAVNPLDWHYMRGSPYVMRLMSGIGKPSDPRMGVDFAGTVEAVGADVTRFKPGDAIFGGANGAFGEYVVVREDRGITHKPANVSFEQAAATTIAAITALQALRDKGLLQKGQKVLINGASGGVGTYAVQMAKAWGAEVHGVCSTRNVELVTSLGADRVYDYKKEDYTQSGEQYDLIIDNIGNHTPLANTGVMQENGILVVVGGAKGDWVGPFAGSIQSMYTRPFVSQTIEGLMGRITAEDMGVIADMMEAGEVRSAIDRRYALAEVPEAIAYSETGRARGKIVITVQ